MGMARVSGRLNHLPSFRRVFPLSGPYARWLPLRPAFDAKACAGTKRGRVPPDHGGALMSPLRARRANGDGDTASADRAGGKTHNKAVQA